MDSTKTNDGARREGSVSSEVIRLLPESPKQARVLTICAGNPDGDVEEELGHWYSPAAVRDMLALQSDQWRQHLREVLAGIDKDECEDPSGWWETSAGAARGAEVLQRALEGPNARVRRLVDEAKDISMEQRPQAMNKGNMIGATERAQQRVKDWIDHAAEVQADTRKVERLAALECKACFYARRMGGAAMTYRPCMSCGSRELYGSTNTDVLCAPCATAGDLCKHCGGDREMRARRKAWPVAYSETLNVGGNATDTACAG